MWISQDQRSDRGKMLLPYRFSQILALDIVGLSSPLQNLQYFVNNL